MHALAASTQDVAIDALAIGAVPPQTRGRLNGAMQAGMLTGRSVFGGGMLILGTWLRRSAADRRTGRVDSDRAGRSDAAAGIATPIGTTRSFAE